MKQFLFTTALILSSFFAATAQDVQPADENLKQEKIQALYVAYITQELKLTPEEAQKFWPVHTQFTSEVRGVKQELPELEKQQAILNIKKKYQERFNPILGNKRCERFFKMDGEFRRKLLERIRKQRQEQQRPKVRRGV